MTEWVYYRAVCETCYPGGTSRGRPAPIYRLRPDDSPPEDSKDSSHRNVKLTDTELIVLRLEGLDNWDNWEAWA